MIPIVAGLLMGAAMGGGIAALQGKDVLKGALMGGAGGALGGVLMPAAGGLMGGEAAAGIGGEALGAGLGTPEILGGAGNALTSTATQATASGAGTGGMFSDGIGAFLDANKGALTGGALGGMMAPGPKPPSPEQGNIYDMTFSQERNPLFGQPGEAAFINQGYKTNRITPVEDYEPTMTAANGGIIALAEGGEPGIETQRYSRPMRAVDPAVAAYNAKLMERANQQYNVNLQPAPNQVPGSVGYIAPPPPKAPTASTTSTDDSISGLTFNPVTQQYEGEYSTPGTKKKKSLDDEMQQPYYNHAAGDGGGVANGGLMREYNEGGISTLGSYSDGGQLLKGPGDGVSDSIPAQIGRKQPARLADGEFVVPARVVSELGNGSTDAGAKQLYAMMDRVQKNRKKTVGKGKVAVDAKSRKLLPA
jgi:hypothetical protein